MSAKQERVDHANALIVVIAKHGRRFFWNEANKRHASISLDERGRIWFIDDYTGKPIYTHRTNFGNKWRGFTHGGTLRALVEDMRDYISSGKKIARWKIAPERGFTNGDIWGYGPEAAKAVREQAFLLEIMEAQK